MGHEVIMQHLIMIRREVQRSLLRSFESIKFYLISIFKSALPGAVVSASGHP